MPRINITPGEIKTAVTEAVRLFLSEQPSLLERDAHEQAISHRIALYLEDSFREWEDLIKIDCEYNLHGDIAKRVDLRGIDQVEFSSCGCDACEDLQNGLEPFNFDNKLFRPDIIVHQRGTDDHNFLVIEIKKRRHCRFDLTKLVALTRPKIRGDQYGYMVGVSICFEEGVPQYKWITA